MALASIPSPGHAAWRLGPLSVRAYALYQSLWDAALGFVVIWAARRFALSGEGMFMLCAAVTGPAAAGWSCCGSARCRTCWVCATVRWAIWRFSSWRWREYT